MAEHVIKLPDVGEGVAEAELVEWHVKVGELVREDAVLAAVMTDKATVEIPSPTDGEVVWLGAEIGDTVAVGAPLIRLKVEGVAEGRIAEAKAHEAPKGSEEEAPAAGGMADGSDTITPSPPRPVTAALAKGADTKTAAPSGPTGEADGRRAAHGR